MKHIKFFTIVSAILLIVNACKKPDSSEPKKRSTYTVTTTVGMVGDIVKNVIGDKGTVKNVIGEGVDPHLYKPTRGDVADFLNADVIFYSGLTLEGKMADVLIKVAAKGKPVFAVTELIDESFLLEPVGMSGHYDPHVWMDVNGWIRAVDAVISSVCEYDPDHADVYIADGLIYSKKLTELNDYALKSLSSIPESSRVLITAHDAFNYFGRAYNIEVMGIQGISTESEAGLKDINNLIDIIVARDIKAVFVETSVASKNVKALIEGAEKKGKSLTIGGTLFSDAMGEPGTYEGTYIGMIDHNVTTITRALGGDAPERGMQGKLSLKEQH